MVEHIIRNWVFISNFFEFLNQLYVFMLWSHMHYGTFIEVIEEIKAENKDLKYKHFSKQCLKHIRATEFKGLLY